MTPEGGARPARSRVAEGLALIGETLPALLLALVVTVIAADVVGRYVLRRPVFAANEIALAATIWLVFLGIVGASLRGATIAMEFVDVLIPAAWRPGLARLRNLLTALIAGLGAYACLAQLFTGRFTFLPLTGLPKTWLTAAAFAGLSLVALIHGARALAPVRFGPPRA